MPMVSCLPKQFRIKKARNRRRTTLTLNFNARFACALAIAAAVASAPDALAQTSDIEVEKSGPAQSAADTDVTYTVVISNYGPDDSTPVALDDTLPGSMTFVSLTQDNGPTFNCSDPGPGNGGAISCTIASLPAGLSATFSFVMHIPPLTPPGTTFTNIATSACSSDPNFENDEGVAVTSTPPPPTCDLSVVKIGPEAIGTDIDIVYTLAVTNAGPDPAQNVVVTDNLPAPLTFVSLQQTGGSASMSCLTSTCSVATFGVGETAILTLTGHVPASTASGTLIQNTATVTSDTLDSNDENDASTSGATVSDVDVTAAKSGPGSVAAGADASYTITIENAGPDPAANVTFSDLLPSGTTFVSLTHDSGPPPSSCATPVVGTNGIVSCTFAALTAAAPVQFTLVLNSGGAPSSDNTVTVTTSSYDTDGSNNSATAPTTVIQSADVSISKTGPDPVTPGADVSYTIVVPNAGPSPAANVEVSDTLPAGMTFVSESHALAPGFSCAAPPVGGTGTITCTAASLANGSTATFTFTMRLDPATASGAAIDNSATVTSSTTDPDGANNSSTAQATAGLSADISVVKTGPDPIAAGTNATYTVIVSNAGPSDATGIVLSDPLPAGTTFVSADESAAPTFDCSTPAPGATGTITCTAASLAAGDSATFSFVLLVDPGLTEGTPIDNAATVTSATPDPNGANGSSTASATVGAAPAAAPIPALSPLMIALLGLALAAAGALMFRSR
jgi:uncharacterized repeat protein (TIGR01451 family)